MGCVQWRLIINANVIWDGLEWIAPLIAAATIIHLVRKGLACVMNAKTLRLDSSVILASKLETFKSNQLI